MSDILVKATGLTKHFPVKGGILQRTVGHVKAVDNVDLIIRKGETLGLMRRPAQQSPNTSR